MQQKGTQTVKEKWSKHRLIDNLKKINALLKNMLLCFVFISVILTSSCIPNPNEDQEILLTFKANYPNGMDAIFEITSSDKMTNYVPIISREGYRLLGWYDNPTGIGSAYDTDQSIDDDLILYAKWELINYSITYIIDGESIRLFANITQSLSDLIPIQEDTAQRVFLGWYDNPSFTGQPYDLSMNVNRDITLYAKWDDLFYQLTIVSSIFDEGYIEISVPKDAYLSDYIPEMDYYGFRLDAWYSDAALTQEVNPSLIKNESFTLYPSWEDIPTEYYVSAAGNDDQEGSIEFPLKTFEKAMSMMTPGDTMMVMGGTYNEQLIIDRSGTEEAYLTFKAYPNEEVIIDGTGIITDPFGIWFGMIVAVNQHYLTIEGFHVIHSTGSAIFIGDNHHVNIINNYTFNSNNPGIFVWQVDDLLIEGNEVEQACMHPESGLEDISLRNNHRVIIRNNYVHDSDNIGIDAAGGVQHAVIYDNLVERVGLGLYVDAWDGELFDVQMYNNISRNNQIGLCVNTENGGSVRDVRVYNNLIYQNLDDGMVIGWGGVPGQSLTIHDVHYFSNKIYDNLGDGIVIYGREFSELENIFIYNNYIFDNQGGGIQIAGLSEQNPFALNNIFIVHNTIVNNGSEHTWFSGGIGIGNQTNAIGTMHHLYIMNNIVFQNYTFSIAIWPWGKQPDSIFISHNLIYGYKNASNFGETKGFDVIESDPLFVNVSLDDYHLLSTSPAIDAGDTISMILVDFEFDSRTLGHQDIGADEYMEE